MSNVKVVTAAKATPIQEVAKQDGDAKKGITGQLASLQRMRDNEAAHAQDTDKAARDTTPVNEPISAEAIHQHLHGKPSGRTY
jgi:hypothetical protein